ncbi:MAG TPA: hypothetical protein DEP72_02650 [Clostridiales bacterium]|nr:MAG: hypothetical protein A2Y18_06485 [Clostridiales bacterium GWD2_32_19]HCC07054.1 hypothetical protein [Clostridiales bacterium]
MKNILESIKYVIDNAEDVYINTEKLEEVCSKLEIKGEEYWLKAAPGNITLLNTSEIVTFVLILETIDFSFWGDPKWSVKYKEISYDGAFGLVVALIKALENNYKILDFEYLKNMKFEDFEQIMKGNIEIPLIKERFHYLKEMVEVVLEKFDGNFYKHIKNIRTDKDLFEIIINNFKCFDDHMCYKGEKIYFYKRAQLLTIDILKIMEEREKITADYSSITACADYKIPQSLRKLEILTYSKNLGEKVDNSIVLPEGCNEEIEIRAFTIYAVERIKQIIGKSGRNIRSIDINDYLWLQGQNKNISDKPYHLVRTTAY